MFHKSLFAFHDIGRVQILGLKKKSFPVLPVSPFFSRSWQIHSFYRKELYSALALTLQLRPSNKLTTVNSFIITY